MQALVKNQQEHEVSTAENAALLSMEILNSLLMRFRIVTDKRLNEHKSLLKSFLTERSLNFLQNFDTSSIQELMQLVVFYGLSLNFLETINIGNINLIQFMFELKKRQKLEPLNAEFILSLWKLLKN